jgi:peptidoglycan hydrolase-like protein with peptidoglycan-binding domain
MILPATRAVAHARTNQIAIEHLFDAMKCPLLCLGIILSTAALTYADQVIRSLQETLKQKGFYYGAVTGEKSAETTAAIRRYQIRNGLKVTGEINDETMRSLKSSPNPVAAVSRPSWKPALSQAGSIRSEGKGQVTQNASPPVPSFSQQVRPREADPLYPASFYQSAPLQVYRRTITGAQFELMRRGFYRGRIDGSCGPQTAFALRAFQSSAGLAPSGRLDMQTLDALALSGTDRVYAPPVSPIYESWLPVGKFKHGTWKVKWKKYPRDLDNETGDEDRQPNSESRWTRYNEE